MEDTESNSNNNYLLDAICKLAQFYNKLPFDNQYKLNSNLFNIQNSYADFHQLISEEIQRALKAYRDDENLIDENYKSIEDLSDLFDELLEPPPICSPPRG